MFTSNTAAGAGVSTDYYRPLTSLTFSIDYKIWKFNPFGYHLTNTLLHIFTAVFLFLFLLKLKLNKIVSFWISVIFLVHPVQVEAVTYLSSRGDVLYSLLVLISLYLFALTLDNPKLKYQKLKKIILLMFSTLLFGVAIFAKEVALATFPVYIVTLLFYKYQNNLSFKTLHQQYKSQLITIGLIIWLSLLYMILRLYVLNFNNSLNFLGGNDIYTSNLVVRIYTFLKIIWLYIGLLFYPYPLYLERDTSIITDLFNPFVLSSLLLLILLIFFGIKQIYNKNAPWILFSLIFIASHILPVSGIVPMTYLYHENWLYMPLVGVLLLGYSLFAYFIPKINLKRFYLTFNMALCLVTLGLIFLTIKQNQVWANEVSLFSHNLKFNNTARLNLNLGDAYLKIGEYDKAIVYFSKANEIAPMPQTYHNLGIISQIRKDYSLAEKYFLNVLQIDKNYLYVYPFLIDGYIQQKEYTKALPLVERLNKIYLNDTTLIILHGKLLYKAEQFDKAEQQFNKALQVTKNNQQVIEKINKIKANQDLF